jgi:MATE family multidrug resistance protein
MSSIARLVPTRNELREMALLAAPVVIVNIGMMLQGTIDALMLGRVSATALAAGAVGNLYFFNVMIWGVGLLMSLDPIVAQALGAGDSVATARGVQRGVVLAVGTALLAALAMWPAEAVLHVARQPDDVIPGASAYVRWSILGLIPFQLFNTLRQTLQAMHRVVPMALAVLGANVVNVLLNWIFIFGHLGFAPMGVVGAAHATWVSRWVMLVLVLACSWRYIHSTLAPWRRESISLAPLRRMIAIGAPVSLQLFAESFAFGFTGLAMGWIGTATLAGHQITLSLAALTFMVPMGVAGATAAMVGRAIGRADMPAARRDSAAGLVCGVGFMAFMAVLFVSIPGVLARAFTADAATIAVVTVLLPIAGVFQVFDGMQVISSSILRGSGDTRVPMILHVLSFWAVGVPLGLALAFLFDRGAAGLWWGLTAGLASAAVLQMARVRSRLSREVRRLHLDSH